MKFSIGLTLDSVSLDETISKNKSAIVYEVAKSINEYIRQFDYKGISESAIIMYVVNPPIGFEHLFKDFKPLLSEKMIEEKVV